MELISLHVNHHSMFVSQLE